MSRLPTIACADGVKMPRLLYGTAWKQDATAGLVAEAIRRGFRGIDTACQPKHYDEAGVCQGVARCLGESLRRDDLYLQTKFSPLDAQDPARLPYDPGASIADQVGQSFARSLENLGTDYIDALILHSPLATFESTLDAWRALERIVSQGGTRLLGCSNCYSLDLLRRLYAAAEVKPAILQNRFYRTTGYDREIRDFCRAHGIVYQSFWTLTANQAVLAHPWLQEIAVRHGRTSEQILFRFLTQQDVVPLTGTTSTAHMREDLAIFDFELREDELGAVTSLLA